MATSGQRDPGQIRPGDKIKATLLNQIIDALVQRITIPGGNVSRVGQAVVLEPTIRKGGGGGGNGFVGLVTKRYGSFISVSQVTGNISQGLDQKIPPVIIDYVWCQTANHPWLPQSVDPTDPPTDYVLCLPAPSGLFMTDPNADPTDPGFPDDFTFPIQWVGLSTVPEAQLDLYRGADADCFFTPFDTGCTLIPVSEDPYPIAI